MKIKFNIKHILPVVGILVIVAVILILLLRKKHKRLLGCQELGEVCNVEEPHLRCCDDMICMADNITGKGKCVIRH